MSITLITSAAYVSEELASELGRLPPAFLPVGNKRLFERQIELVKNVSSRTILTIPETFCVSDADADFLSSANIEIVRVVEGLSLGESVVFALNYSAGVGPGRLTILHGDTLYSKLPTSLPDKVVVHRPYASYDWATHEELNGSIRFLPARSQSSTDTVLSGFFSFSNASQLVVALTKARGNFIDGLNKYNDSIPLTVECPECDWMDFGHVQTYFRSRWALVASREFNELKSSVTSVTKKSAQKAKIRAEASWLSSVPSAIRAYTPNFLGYAETDEASSYTIRNEYLMPLSDLYVFGRLDHRTWSDIFTSCAEFLHICSQTKPEHDYSSDVAYLYNGKTNERLAEFCTRNGFSLDEPWCVNGVEYPSLRRSSELIADVLSSGSESDSAIVHGDFCFSNILYDFRRRSIIVIDPRGYLRDFEPTIYGDPLYDIAKLTHSVIGRYDFIQADQFRLTEGSKYEFEFQVFDDEGVKEVQSIFMHSDLIGAHTETDVIYKATAALFLSMLPLHRDAPRRQLAFLAQGLKFASGKLA